MPMTSETFVDRCNRLYDEHPVKRRWQSELARRVGLNDRTVRRWVSGQAPVPLWMERFIDVLERNPSEVDIFYGEENTQ